VQPVQDRPLHLQSLSIRGGRGNAAKATSTAARKFNPGLTQSVQLSPRSGREPAFRETVNVLASSSAFDNSKLNNYLQ